MPATQQQQTHDPIEGLLAAYLTNQKINRYLIANLPEAAWRSSPPGGKGRDIASVIAHVHNVRLMWLKSAATTPELPAKLDGETVTKEDALRALEESWQAVDALLRGSLTGDGRIKGFKPDVYGFLGYMLTHEAHHRGQISMLARQVGHPLSKSAMFGMWEWGSRSKE